MKLSQKADQWILGPAAVRAGNGDWETGTWECSEVLEIF